MRLKEYSDVIAQAVALETLSPNSYKTIENSVKTKRKILSDEQSVILSNFRVPFTNSRIKRNQFNKVVRIIKAKMELDDAVNKTRAALKEGYNSYR